ncbi:MAG: hypothetical protein EOO36_07625 [Cytophagaceae bacterium]|nr:MAG: hypothetical protein EOO36_07625 [Cytophagaceae bacterium]
MEFQYPSLLRPTTSELLASEDGMVAVPKTELLLRKWQGAPIADSFGGKPLLDFAGRPVFAELAAYELFRLSGWEARWVETYGAPATNPRCYTDWLPNLPSSSRRAQVHSPIGHEGVWAQMRRVAAANKNTFAGCWDVVGWHDDTLLCVELKRHKKDRLQTTQPRWLAAGLRAGLRPENFLLVEWDFLEGQALDAGTAHIE